ncbi:hypothetical protein [Pantoea sp. App145]|uniref:hypothetical protein n=1 Tax=Pantoea sp. App145 TaxID=3071567 RepID=UPI003A80D881
MLNMFLFWCALEVLLFILVITLMEMKSKTDKFHQREARPSLAYDYETRSVILDDRYILATFRSQSLNHTLFEYLYRNPERKIEFTELDHEVLKGRVLNLTKAADAMGFRCDLRRLLFTADGNSITFHPSKISFIKGVIKVI